MSSKEYFDFDSDIPQDFIKQSINWPLGSKQEARGGVLVMFFHEEQSVFQRSKELKRLRRKRRNSPALQEDDLDPDEGKQTLLVIYQ